MKKKGIVILLVLAAAAAAFLMVRHLSRSKDDGTMLLSGNVEVAEVKRGVQDSREGSSSGLWTRVSR